MPPRQKAAQQSIKALSISHFSLLFVLLAGVVFGIMTWITWYENSQARKALAAQDREAAMRELRKANEEIASVLERVRTNLTGWDEVQQQLYDATYYGHWRATRAGSAGKIPSYIEGIELYDARGQVLPGAVKHGAARMPEKIFHDARGPLVVQSRGRAAVYEFFPIYSGAAASTPLGYAGVRLDYLATLERLRPLRYVNVNNLSLVAENDGRALPLSQALEFVKFELQASDAFDTAERILASTLFRIAALCVIAALFGYFLITFLVTRPLRKLASSIDSLREGHGAVLNRSYARFWPVYELEQLRNAFNDYQTRLEEMHLSLEGKNKELWNLAHFDPLTGIYNRRAFEEDWNRVLAYAETHPSTLAFILFDCDHFKAINDTYGHHVGDLVIQGIATSLDTALRSNDRLYRLGGDEFVTVLHDTDADRATNVAQRCIAEVSRYNFAKLGIKEPVQISAGLACWQGKDPETLFILHKQADLAMYQAKKPGHSKLAVYNEEIAGGSQAMVSSRETRAVFEAIESRDSIQMHYQRVVGLPGIDTSYYEALARIRSPEGLILPLDIFAVVEARRLEIEFDLAVIEAVKRDLAREVLPIGSGVSINISGPAIVTRSVIESLLELAAFKDNYRVGIEITETALITQLSHAAANLEELRQRGFKVALDDFGSGYSPLRYLSSMPIDSVKFDIALIHSLQRADRQSLIVGKLAQLIHDSGYELVAEGIETPSLLETVIGLGFTHAQGFYLGKPQPPERLLPQNLPLTTLG